MVARIQCHQPFSLVCDNLLSASTTPTAIASLSSWPYNWLLVTSDTLSVLSCTPPPPRLFLFFLWLADFAKLGRCFVRARLVLQNARQPKAQVLSLPTRGDLQRAFLGQFATTFGCSQAMSHCTIQSNAGSVRQICVL